MAELNETSNVDENTHNQKKKGNPYYSKALTYKYAIHHVLNNGTSITGRRFYGYDKIDELISYVEKSGPNAEIHEILCNVGDRWQRLFFDIDAQQELIESSKIKFSQLMDLIILSISSVFKRLAIFIDDIPRTILCGNRPGKYSARIYFKLLVRAGHSRCIPIHVVNDLIHVLKDLKLDPLLASVIDTGVYNKNHQIRMHLCTKFTESGVKPPLITVNHSLDLDNLNYCNKLENESINRNTIITYVADPIDENITNRIYTKIDCNNDFTKKKCCSMTQDNKNKTFEKSNSNDVETLAGEFVKKYTNYSIRTINGSLVNLYDDRTGDCIICKRKHENENPLLIITNKSVYFKCRRANKSLLIIKGNGVKKTKFDIRTSVSAVLARSTNMDVEFKQIDNITKLQHITGFYEFMRQKKRVAIKSEMGSGKSTELENYIRQLDEDRKAQGLPPAIIVSVVHRISMRESMKDRYKRMGFMLYNEIGGPIFLQRCGGRILIQVESLHRLNIDTPIDLLILDEYNAITQQFLSGLGENPRGSREVWEYMCETSKSVIMLDARLSPINVRAMEIISQKSVSIWINEIPEKSPMNIFVCDYEATWEVKIIEMLLGGKRLDIITTRGEAFCKRLQLTLNEKTKAKILILYGGCNNSEYTSDPNTKWLEFDCIIRSQTINAGVDFNVPHFHSVFVDIGSYGANSDDVLQSMRRSRNLIDNSYYLLFKKCGRYKRPITELDVIEYETKKINHNIGSELREFQGRVDENGFKFKYVNDKLFRTFVHYIAYRNLKTNDIFSDIIKGLKNMGATFEFITMTDAGENKKINERIKLSYEKIRSTNNSNIANARDLEDYEYYNISKYAKHTETDKAEIDKYNLRQIYQYYGEINEEWVKKYRNPNIIKLARNIYLRYTDTETVLQMNREKIENTNNDTDKLNIRLTGALRIALDDVKKIHAEYNKTEHLSTKFMEYINRQIEAKNPLFASKTEPIKQKSHSIGYINDIVLSSLGYEIVKKELVDRNKQMLKIYNYDLIDTLVRYFTPLDSSISINNMPMLKVLIPH